MGRKPTTSIDKQQEVIKVYKATGNAAETVRLTGIPKHRVWRIIWKHKGLCTGCGTEIIDPDFSTCTQCRNRSKTSKLKRYRIRKQAKKCVQCGNPCNMHSNTYCTKHWKDDLKIQASRRQTRVEKNVCVECYGELGNRSQTRCHDCLDRKIQNDKKNKLNGWYNHILDRDNFQCVICHNDKPRLEIHHIIPDGPDEPWNLDTLCLRCHRAITALDYCPDPESTVNYFLNNYKSELGLG